MNLSKKKSSLRAGVADSECLTLNVYTGSNYLKLMLLNGYSSCRPVQHIVILVIPGPCQSLEVTRD